MADTERHFLILHHRCSPRSLMLSHQNIYCASLCAAVCWPYGKESRRQAKMTLVEVQGLPGPRLVRFFGGSTAFFHVIGRGPSALEKGVIVAIMDHVRVANNYRCEHVLIMSHKQAFCGDISNFGNFASPE